MAVADNEDDVNLFFIDIRTARKSGSVCRVPSLASILPVLGGGGPDDDEDDGGSTLGTTDDRDDDTFRRPVGRCPGHCR